MDLKALAYMRSAKESPAYWDLYQPPLSSTLGWLPTSRKYDSLLAKRRLAALEDRMSAAVVITRTEHSSLSELNGRKSSSACWISRHRGA